MEIISQRSWSKVHCNLSIVGQEAAAGLIVGQDPSKEVEFPITQEKEGEGLQGQDEGNSC